ncbi:uncharacterized protein LOC119557396 [Drosophila subpulchrella]|uniref:uncharacterized protein LOC119557396 n=1 Tax=Drosophila subpulchrella TaxID=1486046 RepID=UPI0018A17CD7|nr:uncharacterized protein LOC119557396 [Drosophila subpulchrella]
MLLKTVDINGELCVFTCFEEEGEVLTFYLHKPEKNLSFSETVIRDEFQERLKMVNPRVKFPEDAARLALLTADPLHVDASGGPVSCLFLKYLMPNTAVPLKWLWNLSPLNGFSFYRKICMNSMATAGGLRDQISVLIELLRAKDKELQQYRNDGHKLWRVTAVTKPFDIEAFKVEHQVLLDDATAYKQVKDAFAGEPPSCSSSGLSSPVSQDVKLKTPSTGSTISAESISPKVTPGSKFPLYYAAVSPKTLDAPSAKLSPRNRKRKALEANKNHLERKVMERRSNPQLEYKSSQSSQEADMGDWLTEITPKIKRENVEDAEEPSTSAVTTQSALAKLTKVNATVGAADIKTEIVSKEDAIETSDTADEDETLTPLQTVEFILREIESVQEVFDYSQPPIQEREGLDSQVQDIFGSPKLIIDENEGLDDSAENGDTEEEKGSPEQLTELEELKAILRRTTAHTKNMIEKHGVNKKEE